MNKNYMYVGMGLLGVGMFMGHIISGIIFFGVLSAASLVFLVESNLKFKGFVGKYGFIVDLLLFVLSALAVASLGVTVAGGLGVASLIFTVYRLNFLKPWYDQFKTTINTVSIKTSIAKAFNTIYDTIKDGVSFIKSLFTSKKSVSCVEM